MADDGSFNSMQAQLGLVGGSSSFNPLGIATPAPPPPPMVRHPGDVSTDIVRQTQTQMATTLQTTSAMRLGGMGGMAFGGGGGGGPGGIGAVGAFAHQYQQNMLGINQQHIGAFSAQMMGQMGGMGGGFQPGMLPHPAMMTAPGMGIYRPFQQPMGATVSPMAQMPLFQTPFTPMPPPPMFQTPMELSNSLSVQAGQRRTAAAFAAPGVMARGAADLGVGYMGAGVGAALGARFGPMGALIGGGLGMAAGAFGSEHFGMGAAAQNVMDRMNPFRSTAIRGQQMMAASQDFVTGGPDLNMLSGRGLSASGANHLGRRLEETAYSTRFQRETGGAFSAQDLTKITHVAGQEGLLQGSQSVDQIHDKVKGIAKSLVSFMKIANEPNVVEALKSMGRMRAMGMSVGETMDMAMEARQYSKMAGTSATNLMSTSGAQGAMLFQQQGLSAGLGMRMGMGAMGTAQSAVNAGAYSPQRLAMLGGAEGIAQHTMESNVAFLKQPMLAAAMSTMGQGGTFKVDPRSVAGLIGGKMDIGKMATSAVNNLLGGVDKQGVGAIAMAQMQAPEIQDAIGRILGPKGMELAQNNLITQHQKAMGFDQTPGGWLLAGKSMGFDDKQMAAKMGKVTSRGYYDDQQRSLENQRMELRGLESEKEDREHIGVGEQIMATGFGRGLKRAGGNIREIGEGISGFFQDREEASQARDRGQVLIRTPDSLVQSTQQLSDARAMGMTGDKAINYLNDVLGGVGNRKGQQALFQTAGGQNIGMSSTMGKINNFLGGSDDDLLQARQNQRGVGGYLGTAFGGGLERAFRRSPLGLVLGATGVMQSGEETAAENRKANEAAEVFGRGMNMSATEYGEARKSTGKGVMTELAMELGKMAQAQSGTLGVGRSNVDIEKAKDKAREIYAKKGIKATEKQISDAVSGATEQAIAVGGTNAREQFSYNKTTDSAGQAALNQGFVDKQTQVTEMLYGESSGWSGLMGSKKKQMQDVQEALFSGGGSGQAGTLASLLIAARKNPDGPEAKAAAKLQDEMDPKDVTRATALVKKMDQDGNADLAGQIGTHAVSKLGSDVDDLKSFSRVASKSNAAVQESRRSVEGYTAMFGGEAGDYEKDGRVMTARQVLEANKGKSGLSEEMQEIMGRYEGATTDEEREAIEAEVGADATNLGVLSKKQTKGGKMSRAEKMLDKLKMGSAQGQTETDKSFPHAVATFSEASEALLEAATLLSGRENKPTLHVPASMEAH